MPTAGLTKTTVDLLRHGEVNGADCFRGRTDDPLSALGWRQMSQQCRGLHWRAVVSSPLQRCSAFALAWGRDHHTDIALEPAWMEMDFGDWDGLGTEQIMRENPGALDAFYKQPLDYSPPNAETYANFAARIRCAWDALIVKHAGQSVLVVTHAGVIRVLYSQLLNIPAQHSFQIDVPHACLSRFSCFDDEHGRFVQLNFHKPV
ncbi:alpha-ribazole phosphatase family protein [Methylomonas sp. SURF-2]|uniref:Alpha-ribazole phosphatase family protein n=1 Tax=Methylomonas subterranea TaxID=2952225 RepID=A0ABT1TCZ4_9GAMM|nr:alpha-ribazole phosphatase family protein [Methylomonas sp. SURF-2]MCQ8102649.1 alpha-ribazole phosphatase family protein [Methylomonas sp. SURF-2]